MAMASSVMDTCSPVDSRRSISARGRIVVERGGKAHELVGGFAHGGHDGDHLVPGLLLRNELLRDHLDALRRSDGRAPEFAYD